MSHDTIATEAMQSERFFENVMLTRGIRAQLVDTNRADVRYVDGALCLPALYAGNGCSPNIGKASRRIKLCPTGSAPRKATAARAAGARD